MAQYRYHLKDPNLRENTNLMDYAADILKAVTAIKPKARVGVYEDEFIVTTGELTDGEIRAIGKRLANSSILGRHVRTYLYNDELGYSGQLFIRIEDEI